jgi:hypothetical protein
MPRKLSRRDLLKTGAIATAGIGGLFARPEPAAARALSADVVVGAGYAGLGAAWELFKHGQRVLLGKKLPVNVPHLSKKPASTTFLLTY